MKKVATEKKKKKASKRMRKIVPFIVILILLMICIYQCNGRGKGPSSEYEKQVNAITEIDYSKQQEALNAIVEEGKMNVNYSAKAVFKGTVSEQFNIKNIRNNHHPIVFELFDENGECIYESKKIEPGYEMNRIELQKKLSKGIYECKLKIGYAEEGNVSSVFPISIEVR